MGVDAKQVFSISIAEEIGKKMFVVLEGPDLSGKSTLATQLSEFFKVPLEKNLRIKDPAEVIRNIADQLVYQHPRKTGMGVLKDRWQYPSDIIYEELHGRAESKLVDWEPSLLREIEAANVLFLYVKASPKELRRRFDVRGDEYVDADQVVQSATLYENFFKHRKDLPYKTIDSTHKSPEEVFYCALDHIFAHYKEEAK